MFPLSVRRVIFLSGLLAIFAVQQVTASDNYFPDPEFSGGQWRFDTMGPPDSSTVPNGHVRAQRILALDSDEVIIAGMVPPTSGDSNWTRNLGLARYGRRGFFEPSAPWNRIIYPDNETVRYFEVVDMKLSNSGNRLMVLVSEVNAATNRWRGRFLRFDLASGNLFQSIAVLDVPDRDDFPIGMEIGLGTVYIGGMASDGAQFRPVFQRLDTDLNGFVEEVNPPVMVQPGPCAHPDMSCYTKAITSTGGFFSSTRIYLGGTINLPGPPAEEYFAIRVDANGQVDQDFGANGLVMVGFDEDDSSNKDELADIVAYNTAPPLEPPQDRVFLVGTVDRACKTGIGIVRLNHSGVDIFGDFGDSGKLLFGGAGSSANCLLARAQTAATAALVPNDRLAVGGETTEGLCVAPCGPKEHGSLAVVDINTGEVKQNGFYAAYPGGSSARKTRLLHLAVADGGRLIGTGIATYPDDYGNPNLQNVQRFGTFGFIIDQLFSDRFEQ